MKLISYLKKILTNRSFYVITIFLAFLIYVKFSPTIVISPVYEAKKMQQLELTKTKYQLSDFQTDGCSGDISKNWTIAINKISDISEDFSKKYYDEKTIPFEYACIEHDKIYHIGEGGYVARLMADNKLRSDIIEYAIVNWEEVVEKTPLKTKEEVIFTFEKIAEVIYRGVRVAGSPCSGKPYAWGFGYNSGVCVGDK